MKKCLLILTTILCFNSTYSQALYTENFDNYNIGNLGIDPSGITPGQGGWLTENFTGTTAPSNSYFSIISEPTKGNVLMLSSSGATSNDVGVIAKKVNIDSLINLRTPGNNVIKFEIDYYTGTNQPTSTYAHRIILGDNATGNILVASNQLIDYNFFSKNGWFDVSGKDLTQNIKLDKNASPYSILPFSTWVTLIVYLDYNNKKAYFETPYFNTIAVADFLKTSTSTNLIEDFKPTVLGLVFTTKRGTTTVDNNKYDNIKITALNAVPSYVLSTDNFLTQKLNVYPNPATTIINITNKENIGVEQIDIFDISGKKVQSQNFNNENEVQLNLGGFAAGTYLLYIKTNEGTAIEKVVKK